MSDSTEIVGSKNGNTINRNCCQRSAPSKIAASIRSSGIVCRAARGCQLCRCRACWQTFQTLRRDKDSYSKSRLKKFTSKEWNSEPLVESSECTKRQVFRWLVKATEQLQVTPSVSKACSFIAMDELHGFAAKKIQMLALTRGRLNLWQGPWEFL